VKGVRYSNFNLFALNDNVLVSPNSYMDEGFKRHYEQPALSEGNAGRLRPTYAKASSGVRRRNLLHLSEERVWL
jgi:hypothetical protein